MGTLIVTGSSRGIGAAVARLAGARGYAVAVNYSQDREAAEALAREIGRAIAIRADVGDEQQVTRMFQIAESELGCLDALVNNAGITGGFARVESLHGPDVAEMLRVNVLGTMLCAREAVLWLLSPAASYVTGAILEAGGGR